MSIALGSKIKELRDSKGYTLEKLAELTGSSKSYIWELENKNPPRPSAEKVSKIAEQLGVTIEYLMAIYPTINFAVGTQSSIRRANTADGKQTLKRKQSALSAPVNSVSMPLGRAVPARQARSCG